MEALKVVGNRLLNGWQRVGERDSRLWKPLIGIRLRVSAPPTIAASASPASMSRRPLMIALALEEQAVESAIESAKKTMIHDHISHSLERSFKTHGQKGQAALRDFKLISKYL
ncbi:hypothetical protein NCCP602_34910 [Brevibacterium metallidurans]|uniref:Uncharacterized protein n=1 Tax=Brevibacterium metallidurans TaxID=1482676 RepID=A0ABN0SST6_9MICO